MLNVPQANTPLNAIASPVTQEMLMLAVQHVCLPHSVQANDLISGGNFILIIFLFAIDFGGNV